MSGVAVTFGVTPGNGTIRGGSATTDANGIAGVGSWTLGTTAKVDTLKAAATGFAGSPVTFTATGVAGAATMLLLTTPPSSSARSSVAFAQQPVVQLQDAYGNAVSQSGIVVTATIASGQSGATIAGGATTTGANGSAIFSGLTLNGQVGSYTLTFAATGFVPITSGSIVLEAGPAATIVASTSTSQSAPIRTAVGSPPSVTVRDAAGNAVAGVTVTFALVSGDGTVSPITSITTSADGNAALVSWTLGGTPGPNALTAGASGLTGQVTFTAIGTESYVAVSAGIYHTCALSSNGTAYCWGKQAGGTLGNGSSDTGRALTPAPVVGGLSFDSLTLGGYHACALTKSGSAYCWGENGLGAGPGTQYATVPTQVQGGYIFAAVTAGGDHTCGLTAGGTAYCWGANQHGQLGTGDTASTTTPVPVSGGLTFSRISAGGATTCGVTASGTGYCWGWNRFGMVGDSSQVDRLLPTPVAGGLVFRSIARGSAEYHTCGVTTTGSTYCWGLANYGQLGTAATVGSCVDPTNPSFSYSCSAVPVPVSGGLTFAVVSPVAEATCGVTTSQAAYCWGSGSYGVLGNGINNAPPSDSFPPGPVSRGLLFQRLASGGNWFNCALSDAGALYCWGDDTYSQLGDGATAPPGYAPPSKAVPTRVLYQP